MESIQSIVAEMQESPNRRVRWFANQVIKGRGERVIAKFIKHPNYKLRNFAERLEATGIATHSGPYSPLYNSPHSGPVDEVSGNVGSGPVISSKGSVGSGNVGSDGSSGNTGPKPKSKGNIGTSGSDGSSGNL